MPIPSFVSGRRQSHAANRLAPLAPAFLVCAFLLGTATVGAEEVGLAQSAGPSHEVRWEAPSVNAGDPVNFVTGEMWMSEVDLVLPWGPMSPVLGRGYTTRGFSEAIRPGMPPGAVAVNVQRGLPSLRTSPDGTMRSSPRVHSEPQWLLTCDAYISTQALFTGNGMDRALVANLPRGPWSEYFANLSYTFTLGPHAPFAHEPGAPPVLVQKYWHDSASELWAGFKQPERGSALPRIPAGGFEGSSVQYSLIILGLCHVYFDARGRFVGVEDTEGNGYCQSFLETKPDQSLAPGETKNETHCVMAHTSGNSVSIIHAREGGTFRKYCDFPADAPRLRVEYTYDSEDTDADRHLVRDKAWRLRRVSLFSREEGDAELRERKRTELDYRTNALDESRGLAEHLGYLVVNSESVHRFDPAGSQSFVKWMRWEYDQEMEQEYGMPFCVRSIVCDEKGAPSYDDASFSYIVQRFPGPDGNPQVRDWRKVLTREKPGDPQRSVYLVDEAQRRILSHYVLSGDWTPPATGDVLPPANLVKSQRHYEYGESGRVVRVRKE